MQAISKMDMENWHDYEVTSRREIIALMRRISEQRQLVRMIVPGTPDSCITSLLEIDQDSNTLTFDRSVDAEQNRRILAAGGIECETMLDKVRILFSVRSLREIAYENGTALQAPIPETLIRLQRREYYRIPTPLSNPVRVLLPVPGDAGAPSLSLPLADLSCGGIAILDNKRQLDNQIGLVLPDCRIELPEFGTVTTALQIRNSVDMTLLHNKPNHRLGCQYVDISQGNLAKVQRFITKLEREQNARIAGLV
ncbi:flagellar brake protein [Massilia aerilata]|uniref:Flagellar brake protein YcgR n=1 Tax=Massilia aerilata TaxID=453817 RepID=A0ABW0RVC0_9BURK